MPVAATAVAGLSTFVGELAAAAAATALRGEPPAAVVLIDGASLASARVAPPRASWLDGLCEGEARLGCVRVALALVAAV